MHQGVLSGQSPPTSGFVVHWRADQSKNVMTRHGMGGVVLVQLGYTYRHPTWRIMSTQTATAPITDNTFSYPAPLDSTDHSRPAHSAPPSS